MTGVVLETRPETVPPGTAAADVEATDLPALLRVCRDAGPRQVDAALGRAHARGNGSSALVDLAALLSPAAAGRVEDLAQVAHAVTRQRFGPVVRLYAPLYLSSECVSVCTYCGFSAGSDIRRRTLSRAEVEAEARALHDQGFRHILLVAGEHARIVSKDYLLDCVAALAPTIPQISVEVQVWDTSTYRRLVEAGCDGLTVFQETYNPLTYARVHLRGKKRNFAWRLAAPDRGAEAGMRRLGIGALLGLHPDWRAEAIVVAAHARALTHRWWRSEVTIALPRLRPAAGVAAPEAEVSDADFVQLLCALRVALPDVGINLSTRERPALRDALVPLGVTTMSAGSHTEPGGYTLPSDAGPQFDIADTRSPAEVAAVLRARGYDPVWKDWQRG